MPLTFRKEDVSLGKKVSALHKQGVSFGDQRGPIAYQIFFSNPCGFVVAKRYFRILSQPRDGVINGLMWTNVEKFDFRLYKLTKHLVNAGKNFA